MPLIGSTSLAERTLLSGCSTDSSLAAVREAGDDVGATGASGSLRLIVYSLAP